MTAIRIVAVINIFLCLLTVLISVSSFGSIGINAKAEVALRTIDAMSGTNESKREAKQSIEALRQVAANSVKREEDKKERLVLIVVGYAFLVSASILLFNRRKIMAEQGVQSVV